MRIFILDIFFVSLSVNKEIGDKCCPVFEPPQIDIDATNVEDVNELLLYSIPLKRAMRYAQMRAFENIYQVEDDACTTMWTYDSDIARVF